MSRPRLYLDLESRSTLDLKKVGVHCYAESPETDVLCAAYAVEDEPVKLWIPRQPVIMGDFVGDIGDYDVPAGIEYLEKEGYEVICHNAGFERVMWERLLAPRYGWPILPRDRFRCTMVQALALSLPAGLGPLALAMGLNINKDDDGRKLMLQMAKPRKARKAEKKDGTYWFDDEARQKRLRAYCVQDVLVEREIDRRLLALRPSEFQLWQLDQIINDRGVFVDLDFCNAALAVVDQATRWLNEELGTITGGAVAGITDVIGLAAWLGAQGFPTESVDKASVESLLARPDLPKPVQRVLRIRQEGGGAAVKKISALVAGRSADSRARGLLQFHAAGTGRWAGRRFQPQNIKRPELDNIDDAIEAVATGSADYVQTVFGNPLDVVGDCLRGMVTASLGHRLIAADFSTIEGRIIAWLAGEEWKVQAFRDFDAGVGHDIYRITAGSILAKDPGDVTKPERQSHGKVPELALGYQGGVGAFQKMAKIYKVDITDDEAEEIKLDWRANHPRVEACWHDLERAAKSAIEQRGKIFHVDRIAFRVAGDFLFMRLPSGRSIAYPYPCIKNKMTPWGQMKPQVCYKGPDPLTRQWTDQFAHGGLLFNNAVQGAARDIEAEAMQRLATRGYETGDPTSFGIVLSVHDEVVCEVPENFGSVEEFESIMVELPKWAEGLPVAASAWSGIRYRK